MQWAPDDAVTLHAGASAGPHDVVTTRDSSRDSTRLNTQLSASSDRCTAHTMWTHLYLSSGDTLGCVSRDISPMRAMTDTVSRLLYPWALYRRKSYLATA